MGYKLSQQAVQKTAELVRATEGGLPVVGPRPGVQGIGIAQHTAIIRITNTNPTNGLWKCKWQTSALKSTGTPAITFTDAGEEGWAYGLTDGTLQENVYYLAQFRGIKPDDKKAVFVVGTASVVIVRCVNQTPTNIGGKFIFAGNIQRFRSTTINLSDQKDCWIHECNNAEALKVNEKYLGFIAGKFTDQKDIVLIQDTGVSVKDLHTGITYDRVKTIEYDSAPTAYDNTKGDYVFTWTANTRTLKERLNGHTGMTSPVYACSAGVFQYRDEDHRNGLLKTISALHT